MFPLVAKWFLGGGWKTVTGAVLVGGVIAAFGFLYGAWQVEKGLATKYKAERDAARVLTETVRGKLTTCLEANRLWEDTAEGWNARVDELTERSEEFQARYAAERARRRAAASRIEDLQARINASVTAVDCEGALDQLIAALDWGTQ